MLSTIIVVDDGVEEEDDYCRLSELIDAAEAGLLAQEQEAEDDAPMSQAADEVEAEYFRRKAVEGDVGEPSH